MQRGKHRKLHRERPGAGFADAAGSLAAGDLCDYLFYKRQNLIMPMITGVKPWQGAEAEHTGYHTWLAVLIAGLAVMVVYFLVR